MINEILMCLKRTDAAISVSKLAMETLTGLTRVFKHTTYLTQTLKKYKAK